MVRFTGAGDKPYQWQMTRAGRWIVTTTLEARQANVLTEDALDMVLSEDVPGLLAAVASFRALVHFTLPANSGRTMTLQSDLETAVALATADAGTLHGRRPRPGHGRRIAGDD